jgi:DNA invertase Pin-like site-specific DNA recombinase
MKVALYARVSTDQQTTGLESQVRILKDYCEKNEIKDYEIFMDEGISGTKNSRPALDRMMAAVNSGEVNNVVVYSFSRFARSTTHLLNALQIFKSKGVSFVSITEKIDTSTPVGLAVFSILAAISQLERDLIAERVKAGLANARAKGRQIGRKKTRDSNLIRALLKSGVTFRQAARIAKVSHGSIYAEKRAMLKEEADASSKTGTSQAAVFPEIQAA